VTVPDVESVAFASRATAFTLTLGPTVAVHVRLGRDGIFSGGLRIVLDCPAPPTTTTVAPGTTVPPTTADAATTTIPPTTADALATTLAPTTSGPSTTVVPSVAPLVLPAGELPATGSSTHFQLAIGLLLVVLGITMVRLRPRRN
jgi:LPXTG-motif cell wall-anchored protein